MIPAISVSELSHALSLRDLTDPGHGPHALQCLVEDVEIALRNTWRSRVVRHAGERVVFANEHDLRCAGSNAGIAVAKGRVLRATLGAAVAEGVALAGTDLGDALISCPGIVFRRESPDAAVSASHEHTVWRVRTGRALGTESADAMIHVVSTTLLPDRRVRVRDVAVTDTTAPGTTVSLEVDEHVIGVCGLVRPAVIAALGLDPEKTTALSLTLQLDRVAMLRKGIDDVRLLRSEEPRVVSQMRELGRYRAATVSP